MLQQQICVIFLPRKCELFTKCKVFFTFCSCLSTLWLFHALQDSTNPFVCQFDRAPIFQQYFGRFRLKRSISNRNGSFSENCTASLPKNMQNHFGFCSQFLGDHTRTFGTFKCDFLSRCCFFVFLLNVIPIAPITSHFPFEFTTLVVVITSFTSSWYPVFVGIRRNISFHILKNNLSLFLCPFLLHRCFQFSRNAYLDTWPVHVCVC